MPAVLGDLRSCGAEELRILGIEELRSSGAEELQLRVAEELRSSGVLGELGGRPGRAAAVLGELGRPGRVRASWASSGVLGGAGSRTRARGGHGAGKDRPTRTTNPRVARDSAARLTIPQAPTAPPGRARVKIICKKFHYMRAYDKLSPGG